MIFLSHRTARMAGLALAACGLLSAQSAARPFPQHVTYTSGVILPSHVTRAQMDAAVQSHYSAWKSAYVKSVSGSSPLQKWIKYDETNSTVSEAHGYGMVIAAYMADKTDFDAFYRFYKAHPSSNGPRLLAWKQTQNSSGQMVDVEGSDSATDGDLDVAYALLLADTQWGSTGAINYKSEAVAILGDILTWEVNPSDFSILGGDWARTSDTTHTRPSDFMTDHILAFAAADTARAGQWNNVYNRIATIVNYQFNSGGSAATGLMPDFMVKSGSNHVAVTGTYLESSHDGDYNYNSCRTPWRLPMSYIVSGRTEILNAMNAQNAWIRSRTGGVPTNIMAGYYVKNGTNGTAFANYDDLCFTAPFLVNAMLGASSQSWLNAMWTSLTGGNYGLTNGYYGDAIRLQCLIVASGNWWMPGGSAPVTYTINASAGSGGTISPTGAVNVNQGASQTFTITPSSGYVISAVNVDGLNQGSSGTYTFSNVQAAHTITASFAPEVISSNLAKGKAVTASSSETSAYGPALAVDGTGGTRWSSAFSDPQWLQVDLGSPMAFNRVVLKWEAAYGKAFQIQASTNGSTWSTVATVTSGAGGTQTLNFAGTSARYVRMYGTARGTVYGYSLWEFEVYNTGSVAQYPIIASAATGGSISPSGTVSVSAGSSQTFAITPASGYTIASVTVDGANQGAIASYTFSNVLAGHTISASFAAKPVSTNLALGKTATASTNETSEYLASYAVDGGAGTRWSSTFVDPSWIRIDLGASTTFNRVVLKWEAAYGRAFQIQTSNDGSTWATVATQTAASGGTQTLDFPAATARYVRMYGTARGTEWGYSLWEFEVYSR